MYIICFVSSFVILITKTGSNVIGENQCNLSLHCMNDRISVPVIQSAALKCIKRSSCPILDNNLSCAVNPVNKIHIHLRDIGIKERKNGYWVQVVLSSYDDFIKQGNHSLLVKFSFDEDYACYQFSIPFSMFTTSKDILLPCFRIQTLQKHYLGFYFSIHHETDEIISIQALKYSLSNVVDGQWFGGSVFVTTFDMDHESLYFSLNATQNLKCLFNNTLTVYKSYPDDVCNFEQAPIYKSALSPVYRLSMSRNLLLPCQKYCIYTVFSKSQQCGTLHPKHFIDVSFLQLPATDTDNSYTEVPKNDCEKWNFTIDVKVIQKNIITTLLLWHEYTKCFSSYLMYLYKLTSSTCDPDFGHPLPVTFTFKATPDDKEIIKVFKNVAVGYYCILVVPFLNGSAEFSWTRDSGSFNVTEPDVNTDSGLNKKENTQFGTIVVVAISFLLFFTAFVLWSYSEHKRRSKARNSQQSPEKSNEKGIEIAPLLSVVVDAIYLFYPGDDDSLTDKVLWLKDALREETQLNTITLSDILPEISEKRRRNISTILECGCSGRGPCTSNKKFVVVFSEKVLRDFHSNNLIWKFNEEKAFREVLEYITTDWRKAYCHLFVVAFNENIFIDPRFKSIAPRTTELAQFVIPNELTNLCSKLNSSSSKRLPLEELRMRLEQYDIGDAGS